MPKLITTFIPNGLGIFAVSDSSLSFKTVTSATGVETASLSSTGAFTATSFTGSGAGLSAGTTPLTTLDIDGGTDIGADIVDADLFIVDDGAGGTNRKVTASRLKAYMPGPDPVSADGDSLGTASLEWSDLYLADGGVIYFGNDQDINLTHVADTGLTTNGDFSVGDDLKLTSDAAVLGFGADNDVTLTHVADTALQVNKDVHAESFNLPITLNGTDGSSTHAGDNIILDASAAGTDVGERLLYEGIPTTVSDNSIPVKTLVYGGSTDGQVLTSTGPTSAPAFEDAAGVGGFNSWQIFSSSGTWTKPSGVTKIRVIVVGAGGGGGDDTNGSGGGAGGTGVKVIDVSSISSVTVTIGTGGGDASNATAGGTSSFGSHVSCTGGGGATSSYGYAGAGGVGSSGDFNAKGGRGNVAYGQNYGGGQGGTPALYGVHGGGCGYGQHLSDADAQYGGGGGGNGYGSSGLHGGDGLCIVEEYK